MFIGLSILALMATIYQELTICHHSLTESEVITRKSQTETMIQFKARGTSKKLKNRQEKANHCLAMALTVTKSWKEFRAVFHFG